MNKNNSMAELKRVLSYKVILLIVINSIMGTGIFFLPALGVKYAGAASIISWAVISVIAIYIAMCFAELCSMYPTAGGTYEFCKHAYGRFPSFVIGWLTLIAGNITIAMLIVGAISYLLPFRNTFIVIFISAIFILLFNVVAYRGMKVSAVMLVTFAFITLLTLAGLIIPGLLTFNTSNFTPFFYHPKFLIFLAIFFIAETFFGWESPTFLAGEVKNGERIMPKAMVYGTIIIAIISLLFVVTSISAVGWGVLGESTSPVAEIAKVHYKSIGETIFRLLVYLAIIGSVADWVVSAPRLVLSMAKDRLFLPHLSEIHPKYHTPHKAIVFQAVVSIIFVFIGVGSYVTLLHLLVPILLVLYSLVLYSVIVLRKKKPNLKRYYKAPLGNIGPMIVVLFFISLLVVWFVLTKNAISILTLGISFLLIGLPVYFLLEMYYDPKAVRKTNNILAYLVLWTESISLPKKVRKEILSLLGNIKGKTILEFGCNVGTLTIRLAEEVGKKGRIYATDISERDIDIAKKRLEKEGHYHVTVLHDLEHHTRVHPSVPKINAVVSVGMLGYLQNTKKILKEINERLPMGAKICFLDYDKFFDIIPNIDWLSNDDKVKKIFRDCGFNVGIIRKQGFAWKYVFVYGVKFKDV